jgi:hypothetical protein
MTRCNGLLRPTAEKIRLATGMVRFRTTTDLHQPTVGLVALLINSVSQQTEHYPRCADTAGIGRIAMVRRHSASVGELNRAPSWQ